MRWRLRGSTGCACRLPASATAWAAMRLRANALVLDMRGFNRITLDEAAAVVRVESGASWHDIQKAIHPRWAVKSMQSTDIFTVGGSICRERAWHGPSLGIGRPARCERCA